LKEFDVPEILKLQCLTELSGSFNIVNLQPQTYLRSEVIKLLKEYKKVKEHERVDWIKRKRSEVRKLKDENERYRELHAECKYNSGERFQIALIRIDPMDEKGIIKSLDDCIMRIMKDGFGFNNWGLKVAYAS
jgi:hypothetical protein